MFQTSKTFIAVTLLVGASLLTVACGGRMADRATAGTSSGVQRMTLDHGGSRRNYLVHVPRNLPANAGAVMVFHGGSGNGERMIGLTGMNAAADGRGFVAVYPDAEGGRWNDGRNATVGGADDIGFVRAIVAQLSRDYGVDPRKIFATGISNGAIFSHRLACDAPDLVAAIAPVAGNMPQALRARCSPSRGTPVVMFSGTADNFMPFAGGRPRFDSLIRAARGPATDQMLSAPDTVSFWASVNRCGGAGSSALPDTARDGTTVARVAYGGCNAGDVVFYRVENGGHAWPGASIRERRLTGEISQDINATRAMVEFFARYGL